MRINRNFTQRSKKPVDFLEGVGVTDAGAHCAAAQRAQKSMGTGRAVESAAHGDVCPRERVGGLG